jgi:hypothetical protein
MQAKKSTPAQVRTNLVSFIFDEVNETEHFGNWRPKPSTAMTHDEKESASMAWSEAEAAEHERLCTAGDDAVGLQAIRRYVTSHLDLQAICMTLASQ